MLKIIVAMDEQKGIGIHNRLPWSIKEDLKEFRRLTMGHSLLMGRKTLDSIGKALDGRVNYVVTRQDSLPYDNIRLVHDVEAFCLEKQKSEDLVYIIGGASLYKVTLAYADELIISRVNGTYACDTFFPDYDESEFRLTASVKYEAFTQERYERIKR